MLVPRLLHEAKKIKRLMGLSNPRAKRNVDRMKRIPSKEKIEVTRSVTSIALSWLGLNDRAILKHVGELDWITADYDILFFIALR